MKQKINDILAAMRAFDAVRKEQAQRQSDRDPFPPYPKAKDRPVAPLQQPARASQGRLNSYPESGCSCDTVCPSCVEYQMTLNQAH